jgi:probable addiction module antidote protein
MWEDSQGDPVMVATALGDVARAIGMSQIARDTGVAREALYKALSAQGNPELRTIVHVLGALGLELSVRPRKAPAVAASAAAAAVLARPAKKKAKPVTKKRPATPRRTTTASKRRTVVRAVEAR